MFLQYLLWIGYKARKPFFQKHELMCTLEYYHEASLTRDISFNELSQHTLRE